MPTANIMQRTDITSSNYNKLALAIAENRFKTKEQQRFYFAFLTK